MEELTPQHKPRHALRSDPAARDRNSAAGHLEPAQNGDDPPRAGHRGRHAPARRLRRWVAYLPWALALLVLSGFAIGIGLREIREGLWWSVSTSGFAAAGLCGAAVLLILRMLDRQADQHTSNAHPAGDQTDGQG